jgi:hypothetical protein
MSRLFLLMMLGCCTPVHRLESPDTVPLSTLPARTLSVQQAGDDLWRPELRPGYREPTELETAGVQHLVPTLLRAAQIGSIDADAVTIAAGIGMRIERWDVAGSEHLALTEQPDQRRGAGAYLFSVAHPVAGNPWLLWEAPHPYYDLRTGEIAAALYFNPPPGPTPAAFFTSSLHRYTQADGKREKRSKNPADPCHSETHLFNVATIAAAQAFSQATVVQLHGFASSDDEGNRPPEGAIVVVSDGDRDAPSPLASAAAARLGSILGPGVLLYPLQSAALGATTNVEGRALAGIPGSRFLHVEMAGQLRDLLVQDPSRRDAVGAALFALANDPLPSSPP